MKKKYVTPELDSIALLSEDVILASQLPNPTAPITGTFGMEENEEELQYFKRAEKMKEMISGKFMNLDEAFLDSFVDDLYQNIFG